MRRILYTIVVGITLGLAGFKVYHYRELLQAKPKAPVTHYHGYDLNRAAIQKAKAFTVLISNEGFGGIGRGTGVLIDEDHVLTCAHMVEGTNDDYWIYPYPGKMVVKGKPVYVKENVDLAVFELDTKVKLDEYAKFDDAHYDGEPITIIGNTLGAMRWFVTFGVISGEWEGFVLTDGVLYGGNSGGPWIDEKGDIVALTDWTLLKNGAEVSVHGGIPATTIRKFLDGWHQPASLLFQILISDSSAHKGLTIHKEKRNL